MPKVPIDYANTIIYKLVHKDDLYDENIYTGHTTYMRHRKYQHKESCINPNSIKYNQKKYKYIRENGGWDEWLMIEIEKYPCKDKHEAVARERVIQTEMKATLNTFIAGRTYKEWREDNRDKLLENMKLYRSNNAEQIKKQKKEKYENNPDYVKNKSMEYYYDNREAIREKKREKTPCSHCGFLSSSENLKRHKKTQKCINFKPA